jgi:hypothetical protein
MAKSKKVVEEIEVVEIIETVESTVILNLPKEEVIYPGHNSRDFGKGQVAPEVAPEEEPIV